MRVCEIKKNMIEYQREELEKQERLYDTIFNQMEEVDKEILIRVVEKTKVALYEYGICYCYDVEQALRIKYYLQKKCFMLDMEIGINISDSGRVMIYDENF